jgi:hypothetical protein
MPTRPTLAPTCVFALSCALATALASPAPAAEYMEKNERQVARAFSPGVITEGGRIVWLAGQAALTDDQGRSLAATSKRRRGKSSTSSTRP